MDLDEKRVVIDRTFDRAVKRVLDGFLHAGFRITASEAGDLHERSHAGHSMRYAFLDATLPELPAPSERPLPSCRLALFELNEACTLLTAENRLVRYPVLAPFATQNGDRIEDALRLIVRDEVAAAR